MPNIVPCDAKGRIGQDELRHIVTWLRGKCVTGFYPNGSMGEFIRLSPEERRTVVRIVSESAGGMPILAGAAEPNIELVLEMCKYCADLGCRAVSITGPYYYKLTQESIEAYFRELAAKSPIDIVVHRLILSSIIVYQVTSQQGDRQKVENLLVIWDRNGRMGA